MGWFYYLGVLFLGVIMLRIAMFVVLGIWGAICDIFDKFDMFQ